MPENIDIDSADAEADFDLEAAFEAELISPSAYNFVIGMVLLWGFAVNWVMVRHLDPTVALRFGYWPFIGGFLVCCFAGAAVYNKSDDPVVSFLGYNLVVVPFGFVVNIVVSRYDPGLVLEAVVVTGCVTMVMMLLGSLFPAFFQSIKGALTAALVAVILVEMLGIFLLEFDRTIIDWAVVLIFCGYIGYDWGCANSLPKTLDNAVDSAAEIYMDIIILFLRILRIMGDDD